MFNTFDNVHTLDRLGYACYTSKTIHPLLLEKKPKKLKCPTSGEIETFIFPTLMRDISYKNTYNAIIIGWLMIFRYPSLYTYPYNSAVWIIKRAVAQRKGLKFALQTSVRKW